MPETCVRGCDDGKALAEHGALCYGCHVRTARLLRVATGQMRLLATVVATGTSMPIARGDAAMRRGTRSEMVDAVRVSVLSLIADLDDWASEAMRAVLARGGHEPPPETTPQAVRERRGDGVRTWSMREAAPWLNDRLDVLEQTAQIGSRVGRLFTLMAQAHRVAPWREEVARLPGIECPRCGHCALVLATHMKTVTCTICHADIPEERFQIWERMLTDARARGILA